MKTGIRTYKDLENEKARLQVELAQKSVLIRQDIAAIKEELKPIKAVMKFVGKFTSKDKSNPLLSVGVDFIGDVLLKNILFARAGILTKLIGPFLLKNFSSHLFAESGEQMRHTLLGKFQQLTGLFKKSSNGVRTKPKSIS